MYSNKDPENAIWYSILEHGPDYQLSDHFRLEEFACRDGSDMVLVHLSVILLLEEIRAHFHSPLFINSGYRTPEYNRQIGGSKNSRHCLGMAADIRVYRVMPPEVGAYAETLNPGGLGRYGGFIHVDVFGENRRWHG